MNLSAQVDQRDEANIGISEGRSLIPGPLADSVSTEKQCKKTCVHQLETRFPDHTNVAGLEVTFPAQFEQAEHPGSLPNVVDDLPKTSVNVRSRRRPVSRRNQSVLNRLRADLPAVSRQAIPVLRIGSAQSSEQNSARSQMHWLNRPLKECGSESNDRTVQ